MRWDKVWTVARKDLAEFRKNKYIMYTILLMPMLMGIVLPLIYMTPFAMVTPETEPHDLGLNTQFTMTGENVTGTHSNTTFVNCNITNAVITGSVIEGGNVGSTLVRNSYLGNTTLTDSAMFHSNLNNVTYIGSAASDVVVLGQEPPDLEFLGQFIDFLLMFFIIIPVTIPTVIASYSFVGEKVSKSLEPLLATPTSDSELLVGKSLSIFLPCMAATWLSFIPFAAIVTVMASPVLGYTPILSPVWLVGVILLAPLFCVMSIALNVIVSSKVSDVRASQQIGSLIVLPVVLIFVVVLLGGLQLTVLNMLLVTALVLIIDIGILLLAVKTFRRESILVNWK